MRWARGFGLWDLGLGLQLLTAGSGLAAVAALGAIAAVALAWRRRLWRDLRGAAIGLLIVSAAVAYIGAPLRAAVSLPPIHNISTSTDDPPQFVEIIALRGADSNPLELDAATIAPLQAQAYPWVRPLVTKTRLRRHSPTRAPRCGTWGSKSWLSILSKA